MPTAPASTLSRGTARDPRSLLTPARIDIAVKWRLFRHLGSGTDADSIRVYRWHIEHRTGGVERGSWKCTVDDYLRGAELLRDSMAAHGFDRAHPVVFAADGRLAGGAHRLACALALGCQVHTTVNPRCGRGLPWDVAWFRARDVALADLERIAADWELLTGCALRLW